MDTRDALRRVSEGFASTLPEVDSRAEHDRWKPGIGPFDEEEQLRMLVESSTVGEDIEREVDYDETEQSCDLLYSPGSRDALPIEAKLMRFRYDNGKIDPNTFPKIFSTFPERNSSSLLTDARKHRSGFDGDVGLLGIYYEREDEEYEVMDVERIAEKLPSDLAYWYGMEAETVCVSDFDGLRHLHHRRGAVVTWLVGGD